MSRTNKKSQRSLSCHKNQTICPICCILPPYMLDGIVNNGNEAQRAWALKTIRVSNKFQGRREVLGTLPSLTTVPAGEKRRTIYDAQSGTTLPGKIVRNEGEPPTSDEAVNEAYNAAGATYDLYYEVYERNSIDDRGMRLDSTVHFDVKYDNAFWNGSQMVYGDGDGEIFERFTKAIDVIGHELTHGVTQFEAGLVYWDQPGALNESFSDVFGSLVKQRFLNQTVDQADWIIGAGLFTPNIKGVGIRSMKAPGTAYDDPILGKDPQPAHMKDIYKGTEDSGGVHINSGIPNHAFYLAAMEIGGYAWEKTGKIWYLALRDRLRNRSTFSTAAKATISIAGNLYGTDSKEQQAVRNAWKEVGVNPR